MPQQISITVYQYDELSEKAKEKARVWYAEGAWCDATWAEYTVNDFVEVAKRLNIDIAQRSYRTFGGEQKSEPEVNWDSAPWRLAFKGAWSANGFDANKVTEWAPQDEKLREIAAQLRAVAEKAGADLVVDCSVSRDCWPQFEASGEVDLSDEVEEPLKALCRWGAANLESEWDYQHSRESIEEAIRANDYEFTADGERFVVEPGQRRTVAASLEADEEHDAEHGVSR